MKKIYPICLQILFSAKAHLQKEVTTAKYENVLHVYYNLPHLRKNYYNQF